MIRKLITIMTTILLHQNTHTYIHMLVETPRAFNFNTQHQEIWDPRPYQKKQYQKSTIDLCIPRVDAGTSLSFIKEKLNSLNIGYVQRIYETPLRNDTTQKRILFKFCWNTKSSSYIQLKELLSKPDGSLKVVYDMPWYWKITITQHR